MSDHPITPQEKPGEFLNIRELSDLLRATPITIYRLVRRRALPVYRVCKRILFRRIDVEAFMATQRIAPLTPLVCL